MRHRVALYTLFASTLLAQTPGAVTTVAGTGAASYSGDGNFGTLAALNNPQGVAVDGAGNIYIADYGNFRIRKMDNTGIIRTVAGCGAPSGTCTLPLNLGEGGQATAVAAYPSWSVVVDLAGNFYYSDSGENRIKKVTPSGIMTTYAGGGSPGSSSTGFSGDNGPANAAQLNNPIGLAVDSAGNLYFADQANQRVRKVDTSGIITTVAGSGGTGSYSGDGGPATAAKLFSPHGVAVDSAGNLYIADTSNNRIRKVTPGGTITTVAGNGNPTINSIDGYGLGDGGLATSATMTAPWDVDVDAAGNLYFSDWLGARIRRVDAATGIITTVAGTGTAGFSGDGGPGASAQMNGPTGLTVDGFGNVYFADNLNNRVRRINAPPLGMPSIRTTNSVLPSFLGQSGVSSNMYAEIYGSNFASPARIWTGSDFDGPNAPKSLNGVEVTVNNKPAYIYYVSPTQININVPDDTATGPVEVKVKTAAGTSNAVMVNRTRISPTLQSVPQFNIGGKQYVVALTTNFASYIGRPNMLAGVSSVTAKPGDMITIYALGLGPTDPQTSAGVAAAQNSNVTLPLQLKIGGVLANIPFAGLLKDTIGLYQLNVVIPNVAAGDQKIEVSVDGVANNQDLYIVIGQ